MAGTTTERLTVCDIALETLRCGSGQPVVALHGMQTIDPAARFLDLLSRRAEVIAPSHPGFGDSPRPESCETVYDLVHLYLALLDSLPGEKVTLLGFSFGGWLAAEIAAASCHRIARLVLVAPFGIKLGDRETRDITDVFNTHPDEVRRRAWHDPDRFAPDYNAMEDAALIRRARSWDALCLYGWHPYMYNPRLQALAAAYQCADASAVGRFRPHRHARLWPRLRRADPQRPFHHDRQCRSPSGNRTAGCLRRSRARLHRIGDSGNGRMVAVRNPLSLRR